MFWDEKQTELLINLKNIENFREIVGDIKPYSRRSEQYVEKLFECNEYFEAKELNRIKFEALLDEFSMALFGVSADWARNA